MNTNSKLKLEGLIKSAKNKSVDDLCRYGEFDAECTLRGGDRKEVIKGIFPSPNGSRLAESEKQAFANLVRAKTILNRSDSVTFRCECWSVSGKVSAAPLSAHPDRVEGVLIVAECHEGRAQAAYETIRDKVGRFKSLKRQSITFHDNSEDVDGIFANLLGPHELFDDPAVRTDCQRAVAQYSAAATVDDLLRMLFAEVV